MTMSIGVDTAHKSLCCNSINNCVTLANICAIFTLGHAEMTAT